MSSDPTDKPRGKPNTILWVSIVLAATFALTCCCGISVGSYFLWNRASGLPGVPGLTGAKLDPNNIENTRQWAEKTVARLKDLEAKGNPAAVDAEATKAEKELKDALLNKNIGWPFVVLGVQDDGEVDLEQFFGKDDGRFPVGDDPIRAGKRRRKLYLRIFLDQGGDEVRVGDEITRAQAVKGSKFTLSRKVIEVNIRQRDVGWLSTDRYSDAVDILDTFCVDIIVARRP